MNAIVGELIFKMLGHLIFLFYKRIKMAKSSKRAINALNNIFMTKLRVINYLYL
jgi:hypothetical protein